MTGTTSFIGSCLLIGMFLQRSVIVVAQQPEPSDGAPTTAVDAESGLVVMAQGPRNILQYNARTVELPDGYLDLIHQGNQIYAKPRSGYIHPLYGPDGENLTLDWSTDHPHHRGIYWAWPEVEYKGEMGDIHALQRVFSRPVGDSQVSSADEQTQVIAQNLWLWDDVTPIVFERVKITAYPLRDDGTQAIDFELTLEALNESVTLARRGTDLYGGLNIRLAPIVNLELKRHADPLGTKPQRAWSYATGMWQGGNQKVTLAVLEHPQNADYPGDWITYPELPWFQPAFPKAGTRHALIRGEPLVLRYRFLITPRKVEVEFLHEAFDAYVHQYESGAAMNPASGTTSEDGPDEEDQP